VEAESADAQDCGDSLSDDLPMRCGQKSRSFAPLTPRPILVRRPQAAPLRMRRFYQACHAQDDAVLFRYDTLRMTRRNFVSLKSKGAKAW
jgi:hypothetical protein